MELDEVSSKHQMFYYYGDNHLNVSLINYIKNEVLKNKKIYIGMETHNLITFSKVLTTNGVKVPFEKADIAYFINVNRVKGITGLKRAIEELEKEAIKQGYSGLSFIGQPSYAIRKTSKESFLAFEMNITKSLESGLSSFLCIYDFKDYLHTKQYIDFEVMEESYLTHDGLYDGLKL